MRRVQNTWPIPAMLLAVLFGGTLNAQEHFTDCAFNTGESATIVIEAAIEPTFFGEPFEPGDEIAVFTPSGMCAGVVMWVDDSTNIALTAWGDDPITPEVDGFVTGELLAYRIWSTSLELEAGVPPIDVYVTYDSCDDRPPLCTESGEYERESLTFLSELAVPPLPTSVQDQPGTPLPELLIFPNPVRHQANISIRNGQDRRMDLMVVDALGRTVHRVASEWEQESVVGRYSFDVSGLSPGMYFLLARGARTRMVKPFAVVR